jgi:hypothetical protein
MCCTPPPRRAGGLISPANTVSTLPTNNAPTITTASGPSSVSNSQTTRSLRANSPGMTRAVAAFTLNSWPGT